MTFRVLDVANWFRDTVPWIVFNIDQHVVNWFRHAVIAEIANRVRLQTSWTTQWQMRRTWQTDRCRCHRHAPDRCWTHSGNRNMTGPDNLHRQQSSHREHPAHQKESL
jgi:hypothetical protein